MPCHHNVDKYLIDYLDGDGLGDDPKGRCSARWAAAPASSRARCWNGLKSWGVTHRSTWRARWAHRRTF